jgi:hypothetical protein
VVIRLFSFLAGFLSGQKSYAMKQQPFPIYYEKFALGANAAIKPAMIPRAVSRSARYAKGATLAVFAYHRAP